MTRDHRNARSSPQAVSRRGGGRRLITVLSALCLALTAADFFYEGHPYFRFQELPGIHVIVGVVGSALVIGLGRGLARVLRRDEDYYDG